MSDFEYQRTDHRFTNTADGPIPHLRVVAAGLVVEAPVMLIPRLRGEQVLLRPRVNSDGRYLHAMPGGQYVVGKFVK